MAIGELTIFRPLRTIHSTLNRHRTPGFNYPKPRTHHKNFKNRVTLMLALNALLSRLAIRFSPGQDAIGRLHMDALQPLG
jgi:hypothetical protein